MIRRIQIETAMRIYTFLLLFTALLGTHFLSIDIGVKLSLYRILLLLSPLLVFKLWQDKHTLNGTLYKQYVVFLTFWCLYSLLLIFFIKDFSDYGRNFFFLICAWISSCFIGVYIRKISDLINAFKIVELLSVFVSLMGIYEMITGNYPLLSPENHVYYSVRSATESILGIRVPISIFGNPNNYSLFLIFSIFISYSLSVIKPSLRGRVFSTVVFLFLIFMLLATQSRAGLIALLTGYFFLIFFSFKHSGRWRKTGLIIVGLLLILYAVLPEIILNRSSISIDITNGSDNIRMNLIKNGFVFLFNTFGIGVGIGNIEYHMSHNAIFPTCNILNIHNWWMEILVSSGLLIFVIYIYLYLKNFISSFKSLRFFKNNIRENAISISMCAILIAFVIGSMSPSSIFTNEWFWVLFSLVLVSISIVRKLRIEQQIVDNEGNTVGISALDDGNVPPPIDDKIEKKKILFVGRGYPSDKTPLSGIFEFDQAKAVSHVGYKVIFLSLDLRSIRRWRKWGISSFYKEGIKVYNTSFPVGALPAKLFYKIGQIVIRYAYKIIQKEEGQAHLIHAHFTDMAAIATVIKDKYRIPLIVTEHNSAVHKPKIDKGTIFMAQKAYFKADALIAVSQSLAKSIEQHFGLTVQIIHNIVDTDSVEFAPCPHNGFVFVSIGSLIKQKGFDVLIRAFSVFKGQNVTLQIVGGGPLKSKLQKEITDLQLNDQVSLLGHKSRAEISRILNQSDAFVLASQGETFGVVYIEAMMAGLPIIGTRCGGPEEFVYENNGILVPVNDCDKLSKALIEMKENISKYDKSEIHENCVAKFSPELIATQLSEIYENCCLKSVES